MTFFLVTESIKNIQCLPNEIFYQIFSYLTDGELLFSFHSSDKNDRFYQLIRDRTSINLRSIRRSQFTELTLNIENDPSKNLINQTIIQKICLFNDDETPGIINLFFSTYSFDLFRSFPNLKVLVLDQPELNDLNVETNSSLNKFLACFFFLLFNRN